ncbi:MAG: sensor domain-containing diguanylate cyclase, partial [Leptothrix sp. (in: b-proteobacteria)]
MLTLLARLVGRLSVSRKLMLIYLLDLTSVFYVAGILIHEKFIAIDFARKELAGSAYVQAIADVLVPAAAAPLVARDATADGEAAQAQRSAALQRLRNLSQRHDAVMHSADVSTPLLAVAERGVAGVPFDDVEVVLTRGQDLLTR